MLISCFFFNVMCTDPDNVVLGNHAGAAMITDGNNNVALGINAAAVVNLPPPNFGDLPPFHDWGDDPHHIDELANRAKMYYSIVQLKDMELFYANRRCPSILVTSAEIDMDMMIEEGHAEFQPSQAVTEEGTSLVVVGCCVRVL